MAAKFEPCEVCQTTLIRIRNIGKLYCPTCDKTTYVSRLTYCENCYSEMQRISENHLYSCPKCKAQYYPFATTKQDHDREHEQMNKEYFLTLTSF